ncbi:MAG: hypothetical protein FJW50_02425 [Actinobacteria bacterium]|nr:hypothetical protein [Actinomycetota bacterium]
MRKLHLHFATFTVAHFLHFAAFALAHFAHFAEIAFAHLAFAEVACAHFKSFAHFAFAHFAFALHLAHLAHFHLSSHLCFACRTLGISLGLSSFALTPEYLTQQIGQVLLWQVSRVKRRQVRTLFFLGVG